MDIPNLPLPPDLEEFVSGAVASGKYSTQGDLLREALLVLRDRDRLRESRLQELRKEVQIGLEQSERGECGPWDIEEIKAEVRQRLTSMQRNSS
ncbi:MAG TPA: type II toxin-antitoxin system ParD family antitoxin [Pirellulales bacterium]|nr:type II toxin-antitoxin system ParD family antitoxin [Pirellulales bacterium]